MERFEQLKNSFSNVGTVVFYKHHKYIPLEGASQLDPELFRSSLVKYHGSSSNFPGINFAEYGFDYFPEKDKFSGRLLISDLDSSSQSLIGCEISDTDKIEKVLFPTLVDEDTDNFYEYFGSLLINGRMLYFFECPELYQTIEIYEDVIDSNILGEHDKFYEYNYLKTTGRPNIISPAIIINLGPDPEAWNNPEDFYFDSDPRKDRRNRKLEYTSLEFSRLCDEIYSSKVVCFFLSTNGNVLDFNVSYASWDKNRDPARNKWKTEIRNDEYYGLLKNTHSILKSNGTGWFDTRSDTLVGTKTINQSLCPLLSNKLDRLRRTQKNYYSPYRIYSKGEITTYKVLLPSGSYEPYVVESLIQGNIGNDPLLSGAWILRDKFLDFVTNIIYIDLNPVSSGSIVNPGNQITVRGDSNFDFNITEGLGYYFTGVSILGPGDETIDLTSGDDYVFTLQETETEYNKTVTINSWGAYIDPESERYTNHLIFNFEQTFSVLKIQAKKDGVIYPYSEWPVVFPSDVFDMTLKINGSVVQPDSNGYVYITNPELNPGVELDLSGSLIKRNIESSYRIGNEKLTKIININSDVAYDTVDFAKAEYTINLERVERILSIRPMGLEIICDVSGLVTVDYNSSYTVSFRVISEDTQVIMPIPRVDLINFGYDSEGRMVKYENDITFNTIPDQLFLELDGVVTATASLSLGDDGKYHLVLNGILENTIVQICI